MAYLLNMVDFPVRYVNVYQRVTKSQTDLQISHLKWAILDPLVPQGNIYIYYQVCMGMDQYLVIAFVF